MFDVSICICTFKRPELLRRLLMAIWGQKKNHMSVQIVVVDNDGQKSAAATLKDMQSQFGDSLISISLSEPNISMARNAAIHASAGRWILMVDDDEYPESEWLYHLFRIQKECAADVVFAPVVPEYADEVPHWIRRGAYFDRRRLANGTLIGHKDARSGNVLVRRSALIPDDIVAKENEGPFDPAFGRTGGEDSMLFRHLALKGVKMVWCDDAPVYEYVPPERATVQWLLQRSFRTGQLFMRTELAMLSGFAKKKRACWLAGRAFIQMGIAGLLAIVCLFRPLTAFSWLRILASQMGKLSYFWGGMSQAYGAT